MHKKSVIPFIGYCLCLLMAILLSACLHEDAGDEQQTFKSDSIFNPFRYDNADPLRGGRLYDNWWKEKSLQKPSTSNPIWIEIVKQNPSNTNGNENQWRCKECHGWDYKGFAGAYGRGSSHYTGIRGLDNSNPDYTAEHAFYMIVNGEVPYRPDGSMHLASRLKHQFVGDSMMSIGDAYDLAKFLISKANAAHPNPTEGNVLGGAQVFYDWGCGNSGCHTSTATLSPSLNRLIDVANNDPEMFLHKVRFGAPNSLMPDGLHKYKALDLRAYVAAGEISSEVPNSDFNQVTYDALGSNDVVKGGKLYDQWWDVATESTEPLTTHPKWPEANNFVVGSGTWRCSECHGWDYRGADGINAAGNHATGFRGIVNTDSFVMQYLSEPAVYGFLETNTSHGFTTVFTQDELYQLTKFIMSMRIEVAASESAVDFIDDNTKLTKGTNAANGKKLYNTANNLTCANASCHGEDGKAFDFADGDPENPPNKFVHDIAQENPWEFIHKIRFGLSNYMLMPALYNVDAVKENTIQAAADILAYSQTKLTSSNNSYDNADAVRGGRLFDNWMTVMQTMDDAVQAPIKMNPYWINRPDQNAIPDFPDTWTEAEKIQTSWRCVTCHDWDYKGIGFNIKGSDNLITSIETRKNTFETIDELRNHLYEWIRSGLSQTGHKFGIADSTVIPSALGEKELWDLVRFLLENGLIDSSENIVGGVAINVDTDNGKELYDGSVASMIDCNGCHGIEGNTPPPTDTGGSGADLDIFELSSVEKNPWKFLHKIRFGQPGTAMPSLVGTGILTNQDVYDLLGYAQQEFNKRE